MTTPTTPHYVTKCSTHGTVYGQCHCPSPSKETLLVPCNPDLCPTPDPTRYFLGSTAEPDRWVEVTKADYLRTKGDGRRDRIGLVRDDGSVPSGTVIELVRAGTDTTPTGTPPPQTTTLADLIAQQAAAVLREALADYGPDRTYTQLEQVEAYLSDPASWEPIETAQAPLLAAARREGAVQALRDAAEHFRQGSGSPTAGPSGIVISRAVAATIDARADAIEAGEDPS